MWLRVVRGGEQEAGGSIRWSLLELTPESACCRGGSCLVGLLLCVGATSVHAMWNAPGKPGRRAS